MGRDYRWDLEKIPDINHLHATKGQQGLSPEMPQYGIDGIQHIAADHAYFIYDQQLQLQEQVSFCRPETDVPK